MDSQTYSVAQAARFLGLSPSSVRRLLSAGRLYGRRAGRCWRIPPASLEAFLRQRSPVQVVDLEHDDLSAGEELALARSGRCPVCASPVRAGRNETHRSQAEWGWGAEFLECPECDFTLYQVTLDQPEELHQQVGSYLQHLRKKEAEGRWAFQILARRAVNRRGATARFLPLTAGADPSIIQQSVP